MPRKQDDIKFDDELGPDVGGDEWGSGDDSFNPDALHVNFTDEELASEGRSYEPIPGGKYRVVISKIDPKQCGTESKNPGKWYYNIQTKVMDDVPAQEAYKGRYLFTNVMLFDGALYSYVQLCKACGYNPGSKIRPPADFLEKVIDVSVVKIKDTYAMNQAGDTKTVIYKNEIKGFLAAGATKVGNAADTLMP
jgi:hypothetical protein